MRYKFFVGDVRLPVSPGRVDIRYGNKLNRVELVSGTEIVFPAVKQLCEIEFTALLPQKEYPFAVYNDGFRQGDDILNDLVRLKESGEAFRFIMMRSGNSDNHISVRTVFREIRVREDAKEGSDIYVDIKLLEHRRINVTSPTSNSGGGSVVSVPVRPVEVTPVPQTYTVVRGDSLWLIAHRFLGNGSRWPEIYNLNKDIIDARNKGTGQPYYTIYSGQVFAIPT